MIRPRCDLWRAGFCGALVCGFVPLAAWGQVRVELGPAAPVVAFDRAVETGPRPVPGDEPGQSLSSTDLTFGWDPSGLLHTGTEDNGPVRRLISGLAADSASDGLDDTRPGNAALIGGPCEVADFDDDGDVDLVDFGAFQRCFTGASGVGDSLCRCLFDFDSNDSIDLADFEGFAARFSGPVVSATLVAKLYASDAETQQQFGHSIAIGDNYAMVGVPRSAVGGAVYVFRRIGETWIEQQKLIASDTMASDRFGQAVCVSGNLALIGADGNSEAGISSGAAYVFRREGSVWVEEAKLTAGDAQAAAYFGWSVGLSGSYALVGAYADDGYGPDAGAVYVFVNEDGAWHETQKLAPDDIEPVDLFGWSLAASGDDYAVVGAVLEDAAGSADAGSAYVFFNDNGTWIQQAKLVAADADAGDMFGFSVSLSGDSVVIGALGDDSGGTDAGAAYAFFHDAGIWAQEAKLSGDLLASFDAFGASVSLDGAYAIVGAWKDDDDGSNSGSAFLFRRDGESWRLKAKLTAPDAVSSDYFGGAVAISGNEVFVGAKGDDDAGDSSGSVYVLRFD